MLTALAALATVAGIPVLLMLATCVLARVESSVVPGSRTRPALPTKPSPAPPSRRLTLVADSAPAAPEPPGAPHAPAPLPQAS